MPQDLSHKTYASRKEPRPKTRLKCIDRSPIDRSSLKAEFVLGTDKTHKPKYVHTQTKFDDLNSAIGINPRMYKQIHTPAVLQGAGEAWMEPPKVSVLLTYNEIILH